ncbi:MAG: hypothetical protein ABGY75_20195 [Gemmataceae bacterium]
MTPPDTQLDRIERLLAALVACGQPRAWYSVAEFARLVGRSAFTCREWCRLGRLAARKKASGRGAHTAWSISHAEYERFQREGLRPCRTHEFDPPPASDESSVRYE